MQPQTATIIKVKNCDDTRDDNTIAMIQEMITPFALLGNIHSSPKKRFHVSKIFRLMQHNYSQTFSKRVLMSSTVMYCYGTIWENFQLNTTSTSPVRRGENTELPRKLSKGLTWCHGWYQTWHAYLKAWYPLNKQS